MKSFNLLSKKSLSFVLFVLAFCSQSLFAMDGNNNNDKYNYSHSRWSYLNPLAYVRWGLGTGEYAPKKVIYKKNTTNLEAVVKKLEAKQKNTVVKLKSDFERDTEYLKIDHAISLREKDSVITSKNTDISELRQKIVNLNAMKNPTFYSMMCKNKKKTAAIFLGGAAATAIAGGTTYYLYRRYQKNKMEKEKNLTLADRFAEINEEVVNMYKSIDAGIENTENLFVKTCNTQRKIIIDQIKSTKFQTLMGNLRNEAWVKENSRKIKDGVEGFKNIQELIAESILDESTIKKNCKVVQRIHDNLKKVSSKRTKNNEELTKQIGKDYTFILKNLQSSPKYSSSLRLIVSDMKTLQKDLFGGADKSEKFQVCKFQINPTEWNNGINSRYKKLKKELTKVKIAKDSKHSGGFFIEKDQLEDSLFNFKEEKTFDKVELIKSQGKKWKKSQKPLTKLYNFASECTIL